MTRSGTITSLMRLSKTVHRATSEDVLGMTFRKYWVLSVLSDHDGSRSQHELGQQLLLDANNLVLLLNELEDAGFIRRERDPEDRRRHIVVLTDEGREAFKSAELAQETVEYQVLSPLNADERNTLRELLIKALGG
jgi:DNA-binding MarR family transcriptional regulator